MDDIELLRKYVAERSETAFTELVRRNFTFVYRSALRQARGDSHRAEDVSQIVFTLLARKASSLVHHPALAGWLHTTTHLIMSQTFRSERRRQSREHQALAMDVPIDSDAGETAWEKMRPLLDEVLRSLGRIDREAVLLRYFSGLPFAEIGAKLSMREDAVRMRVNRALDRMRLQFGRRGLISTAAAAASLMVNESHAAAPSALAAEIAGRALSSAAGAGLLGKAAGARIALHAAWRQAAGVGMAAVVAAASLAGAFLAYRESRNAEKQLETAERAYAAASVRQEVLEVQARRFHRGRAHALHPAARRAFDPRTEGKKFLASTPAARSMVETANRLRIRRTYSPFIRLAHLTPAQAGAFERLLASTWADNLGLMPSEGEARDNYLEQPPPLTGPLSTSPSFVQMRAILGSDLTEAYEAYEDTMQYPYQFLAPAAATVALAGAPLSAAQIDRLALIIADCSRPWTATDNDLIAANYNAAAEAVDWVAVAAQAKAYLTADQFAVIRSDLVHLQWVGNPANPDRPEIGAPAQ